MRGEPDDGVVRNGSPRRKLVAAPESAKANGTATAVADRPAPDLAVDGKGERLGDHLLRQKTVTADALLQALSRQAAGDRRRIGDLLVESGAVSEVDLAKVLADRAGLELVDLRDLVPEADAVALLGETIARSRGAVPVRMTAAGVDVVVADPGPDLAKELEVTMGRKVRLLVAPSTQVRTLLDASYRVTGQVQALVGSLHVDLQRHLSRDAGGDEGVLSDDAPVVQLVNLILTQAMRDRASDVHIEPQQDRVRIRFRIDGALHDTMELPPGIGPALASRLKIMARLDIVERRRPQDGQLTMPIDGRDVDMRLSLVATIWGETAVIRLLDTNRSALRLSQLGMPEDTNNAFSKLVHAPFGMVLCAGPTGSGKTTTLYAALGELNEVNRNITTVEDPVEYIFDGINQIQVNEQGGVTFATGLRSILRQDPDVILVGEVRDAETARIAVQSALTGHLVLSTLHGTDAVASLHRLLDMGIESFLVASSIVAVVGQRLVRRICPSCVTSYTPSDEDLAFFHESGGKAKSFVHGAGCSLCSDTGYRDRIGVYELLRVTPEIKQLLVGWATQEELRRVAESQGMRTLRQEAISLVERGVTTIDEVVRSIYSL
jgi:type IV pilus assembly protein PilB